MKRIAVALFSIMFCSAFVLGGNRYNFNSDWLLHIGESSNPEAMTADDSNWKRVTLPYAWNQAEAYTRNCSQLSDTTMWYRKHFVVPKQWKGKHVFIEFEGARFGANVYVNGKNLGWAENGVMAFGFDLTPYIKYGKENVIAVFVDNDWNYHEHSHPYIGDDGKEHFSTFQWNNKNFYCNYGGINKRVWLHVMDDVYQTLPLYSSLGTTGTYVYASYHDIANRTAVINVETQAVNAGKKPRVVRHKVCIYDKEGEKVSEFCGEATTIQPGDTVTMKTSHEVSNLHFWSWGYGYLYTVKSIIEDGDGKCVYDTASITTGFRKTEFKDGMISLNDRTLHVKGFAQRSTNEWPALGISLPAWMSDYSNRQILGCNGNIIRWMHVTPSKQDIESLDRLGILQAMPAGDAEKDVDDRRWQQRCEVMRDAIIYNRNNPSIMFYEGGNNAISEAHMAELKAIKAKYDPNGGRAIGSRNMQDSKEAEYGGEMLYVNKSAGKPMWMMEYNRDEGIRRYWDEWSYPYHKEGEGPLYRGSHTPSYNHNQDGLAIENIVRWNEYWKARPGTGKRVNAGAAKIIFSDSNTHARGEKNYRTSGDVDAMRIPKDSYFCHRVMWNGWVDTEEESTYIIGHWNYEDVTKPVYVCSTADEVELFVNGKSLGKGEKSETFLFTFRDIKWEAGTLRAVGYKDGKQVSEYEIQTVGEPVALRMHWVEAPAQMRADGSDVRIAEVEAVDEHGRRNPLAHDIVHFDLVGQGEYLGGVSAIVSQEEKEFNSKTKAQGQDGIFSEGGNSTNTNGGGSNELLLEAGVIRVIVRSTTKAGEIKLTATPISSNGTPSTIAPTTLSLQTIDCPTKDGFYVSAEHMPVEADWSRELPLYLERGETPSTPSFKPKYVAVKISEIEVPTDEKNKWNVCDDNEISSWTSDGRVENAWIKLHFDRTARIAQVAVRFKDFRSTSYPIEIYAGDTLVWTGDTPKTLGDVYFDIPNPVDAETITIRMKDTAKVKEAFASMTELADKAAISTKASVNKKLCIFEVEAKSLPFGGD